MRVPAFAIALMLPLAAAPLAAALAQTAAPKPDPAVKDAGPPKGAAPAMPPVAPAKPYKPVAVKLPEPLKDPAFDALRKQLGEATAKKDRAALAKLVIDQGFFWDRENGDAADKKKTGADNLAAALALNSKDSAGWDMLAGYAQELTASAAPDHKGAMCSPADPSFNDKDLQDVVKATGTDPSEWAYPLNPGVEVRASAQGSSPVVEKLGLHFIRVMPEAGSTGTTTTVKIVTPSGKTGFVSGEAIAPLGNDQICYVKDGSAWKIGGYIGGGESQ